MLDYFINFVRQYIDVPSGVSFEDFILQCIAAIHPPTYIHSCMVGQISERIAYHILRIKPEIFVGMPGCEDLEAVKRNSAKLLDYVYHAALCHDFGKICIIDTIFVYGRKLLDFEFDIIKSHPQVGADLLRHHISTRDYADVALGHHRWYNDSKGYPFDFNTSESPYKAVIDIVQCADCMDAATDSVGRSYNKGKTLDDFMVELKEDSGTRYAPWLYDLFLHQEVFEDVEFLLDEGRQRNYKDTFNLLKDVQDRG
jgi:HD-GYP domain-containing protein (c-di-GMP phosphodiesterase class II)